MGINTEFDKQKKDKFTPTPVQQPSDSSSSTFAENPGSSGGAVKPVPPKPTGDEERQGEQERE